MTPSLLRSESVPQPPAVIKSVSPTASLCRFGGSSCGCGGPSSLTLFVRSAHGRANALAMASVTLLMFASSNIRISSSGL